jgi:hypothetical protein
MEHLTGLTVLAGYAASARCRCRRWCGDRPGRRALWRPPPASCTATSSVQRGAQPSPPPPARRAGRLEIAKFMDDMARITAPATVARCRGWRPSGSLGADLDVHTDVYGLARWATRC